MDEAGARRYAILAAEQEHAKATTMAAKMCMNGIGGPVDVDTAVEYYKIAAEQGDDEAHAELKGLLSMISTPCVGDLLRTFMENAIRGGEAELSRLDGALEATARADLANIVCWETIRKATALRDLLRANLARKKEAEAAAEAAAKEEARQEREETRAARAARVAEARRRRLMEDEERRIAAAESGGAAEAARLRAAHLLAVRVAHHRAHAELARFGRDDGHLGRDGRVRRHRLGVDRAHDG